MPRSATPRVAVTGLGAVSPIGRSVIENCASVRAGVCRFREWPGYVALTEDPAWDVPDPFVASLVVDVPAGASGPARLVELATLALGDLFRDSGLRRTESGAGLPVPGASRAGRRLPNLGARSRVGRSAMRPRRPAVDSGRQGARGRERRLAGPPARRSAPPRSLSFRTGARHLRGQLHRRGSLAGPGRRQAPQERPHHRRNSAGRSSRGDVDRIDVGARSPGARPPRFRRPGGPRSGAPDPVVEPGEQRPRPERCAPRRPRRRRGVAVPLVSVRPQRPELPRRRMGGDIGTAGGPAHGRQSCHIPPIAWGMSAQPPVVS